MFNPNATPSSPPGEHDDQPVSAKDPRYFWLSVFQYVILSGVGLLFVYFLLKGVWEVDKLKDTDTARGLITYLVAVTTIAIATMLTLSSMLMGGTNLDRRFTMGKEVLTLMVGILGTIIGFYFGASARTAQEAQSVQASALTVTPAEAQPGQTVTIEAKLTGGTGPYTYAIKFDNDIEAVENQTSADGTIKQEVSIPASVAAGTQINFTIEGKDKANKDFVINKDGKVKIPVKAAAGGATTARTPLPVATTPAQTK